MGGTGGSIDSAPPNHGPLNHGPPNHGPLNHGPPNHGPPNHGPHNNGPPNYGEYVEGTVWRVFVSLNGLTLLYAFGINGDATGVDNTSFKIDNFVSHLQSYGFDVFAPLARRGQAVPPEKFEELVMRWWCTDERRCSKVTSRWGAQPLTFWELWGRMYEAGFGIPNTPY